MLFSLLCLAVLAAMLLCSCGGSGGSSASGDSDGGGGSAFEPAEFRDAVFDEEAAEGVSEAMVDLSHGSDGYFALKCEDSGSKIKLQVLKDDNEYVYDVEPDRVQVFPFQLGDGTYTINVMKNVSDSKYSELYSTSAEVSVSDEFQPFIRPNQYADYSRDSKCVKKASELAASAEDASGFITAVYDYVCENIAYDSAKASGVSSGYIPDPDKTMDEGKGICFDYASLAASMLRSQGIPTKIIFGYVEDENGELYHAWNMYYTEESGWVAVEFEVKADDWNRLDLTFSAGGEGSKFISDNSNYMDVYEY